MANNNYSTSRLDKIITPFTIVIFYLFLAVILGIFIFKYIPPGEDYKAIAAVGGIGVTLLLGLMGQNLTIFNAREQMNATRENLTRQIKSTEKLAEAQRKHTT